MSAWRSALDASVFCKITCDVRVPNGFATLIKDLICVSGELNDIHVLCDDISLECPCTKFLTLQEADSLDMTERTTAVAVKKQKNVAVPFRSWDPAQILIKLLSDQGGGEEGQPCVIGHMQFDNTCDSFTVDRLDGRESDIVLLSDYYDSEKSASVKLSLLSAFASVVRVDQESSSSVSLFVRADAMEQRAKRMQYKEYVSYAMPVWYGHMCALWLSNVVRAHVLCNAALPMGVHRPFCLDAVRVTPAARNTNARISMFLHNSTCACICGRFHSTARPLFRASFCGTRFNGECDRHGSRSINESCASVCGPYARVCLCGFELHAVCTHNDDTEALRHSVLLMANTAHRDEFLSLACDVGCGLASDADQHQPSIASARKCLHSAYRSQLSMQAQEGEKDDSRMELHDSIMERMLRSKRPYKKRKQRSKNGSGAYKWTRTDGLGVGAPERAVLSTHAHLLGISN
jgi:hypothetical protein